MAAKIKFASGDVIEVGKAFVSGKDRIKINGEVAFEGELPEDYPMEFTMRGQRCQITYRKLSKMLDTQTIRVKLYDGEQLVLDELYDQNGQPVDNSGEAKANSVAQACGIVGMVVGLSVMMGLNMTTQGAVPGGAIGGAIGGGVGGALGYGLGKLIAGG
ncbi:MAG: hypothetical protein AAGB26_06725 [Planctomycetota bacterium]